MDKYSNPFTSSYNGTFGAAYDLFVSEICPPRFFVLGFVTPATLQVLKYTKFCSACRPSRMEDTFRTIFVRRGGLQKKCLWGQNLSRVVRSGQICFRKTDFWMPTHIFCTPSTRSPMFRKVSRSTSHAFEYCHTDAQGAQAARVSCVTIDEQDLV